MSDSNIFLLSWDCYGIEAVINVSNIEKEAMWHAIGGPQGRELGSTLNAILIRARMNPHRNYEIYTVTVDGSITEEDLRQMFEDNPQGMAELVRERGRKIFSDRAKPDQIKII